MRSFCTTRAERRSARYPATAGRPQVGQNFHPTSSSDPHAGQFIVVTFWPQCGQNVTARPLGSTSLHDDTARRPAARPVREMITGCAVGVADGTGVDDGRA